jgi:uncharacterized beta-barrel protein YwiB (DUF1934 family)
VNTKKADEKSVMISIRGAQNTDDEDDVIEFITAGEFYKSDTGYEISYIETELTGMEGTETRLSVEGRRITMMRTGRFSTQMIFEKGQKHLALYETPAGTLLVGVNASSVDIDLDDKGGRLAVDYSVEIDHVLTGYNRFELKVHKAGDSLPQ